MCLSSRVPGQHRSLRKFIDTKHFKNSFKYLMVCNLKIFKPREFYSIETFTVQSMSRRSCHDIKKKSSSSESAQTRLDYAREINLYFLFYFLFHFILVYTTQVNSAFRALWLVHSEVISQYYSPLSNRCERFLNSWPLLIIQLVWYILKQLFTSVSVEAMDIYLHFGE